MKYTTANELKASLVSVLQHYNLNETLINLKLWKISFMKIENEKYLIMLKIIALLCGQVICGYSMFWTINFVAHHYVTYFSIVIYFINLVAICYVIYCYQYVYTMLASKYSASLKNIKIGFFIFYALSLLSYEFVGGSYSPFFLIGIKLAQYNTGYGVQSLWFQNYIYFLQVK